MNLPDFLSVQNTIINAVISLFAFFAYWLALGWDIKTALEYGFVLFLLLFVFDFILSLFNRKK